MDAVRQDFEAPTNADFSEEWTLTVDGVNGFDVTGYSFKMDFKAAPSAATAFALATVASSVQGIYAVEPENGFVQIRIDKETLDAVFELLNPLVFVGNEMRLYYDLLATTPDADDEVWLFGYLTITKGITNV